MTTSEEDEFLSPVDVANEWENVKEDLETFYSKNEEVIQELRSLLSRRNKIRDTLDSCVRKYDITHEDFKKRATYITINNEALLENLPEEYWPLVDLRIVTVQSVECDIETLKTLILTGKIPRHIASRFSQTVTQYSTPKKTEIP